MASCPEFSSRDVVVYFPRCAAPLFAHEEVTLSAVAAAIADLQGGRFLGLHGKAHPSENLFFVPSDPLLQDEAAQLGIDSPARLFGAVVPFPFVKTKAITHRLLDGTSACPSGWSTEFSEQVSSSVLPGYSVFSLRDAHLAAARLLRLGTMRVKEAWGAGGYGQTVISTPAEFETFLENYPEDKLVSHGLVLESNLCPVITRSVGQVGIGHLLIAYHGVQRTTLDNARCRVYGGSDLVCVRGDWDALDKLPMDADTRLAVTQARHYDHCASAYSGFFASRRNYDVAQGIDSQGEWHSGVLEPSWRSGGASPAELAVFMAFQADPTLQLVEASSVKQFGHHRAPNNATVLFRGEDPDLGPLLRYTAVRIPLRRVA
jgi:hypothetical protein